MDITDNTPAGVTVIELAGRFDAHAVPEFSRWLDKYHFRPAESLVIDLAKVHFIDSAALAALVRGLKRSGENRHNFALSGLQVPVRVIFELTRLDYAFKIYENRAAALAEVAHVG